MTEQNQNDLPPENGDEPVVEPQDSSTQEGADFAAFEEDFGDGSELLGLQKKLDEANDELARARAQTYNVDQQYRNYVRRSKEDVAKSRAQARENVVEELLPVLDDIEAARAAGDLADGPFAAIADKLEAILSANFGMVQFGAPGEAFDPNLHDALMANPNPDVTEPVISQVLQPGFKVGDRVLRPTKVIVENPA